MLLEIDEVPAACWIAGEPTEDGLYLCRFVNDSRQVWFYLYECRMDGILPKQERRNKPLYFAARGGSYATDRSVRDNGKITHHCRANGMNFDMLVGSLANHTYDFETNQYKRV